MSSWAECDSVPVNHIAKRRKDKKTPNLRIDNMLFDYMNAMIFFNSTFRSPHERLPTVNFSQWPYFLALTATSFTQMRFEWIAYTMTISSWSEQEGTNNPVRQILISLEWPHSRAVLPAIPKTHVTHHWYVWLFKQFFRNQWYSSRLLPLKGRCCFLFRLIDSC